ncbi:MAG: helix-turn-helix transcriptional regulator [Clostridia bacterium]|nr:helix-turn-helix transcriptional regulator [Clostridia bacterium]
MYNIGQKIKELRKKNDLTQEKLADYLGVSYQAVSKWETGVNTPDLSLIGPLTKLLHVTADELLGLTVPAADERRAELENLFQETWKSGDLVQRYDICKTAVQEYPGDMEFLDRFAWITGMRSFEFEDDETYRAWQEEAICLFARVIEDCTDIKIRCSAISGIVQYLSFRGRLDEAKKYAELYPDDLPFSKDHVLADCLTGEEKIVHEQKMLLNTLHTLLNQLNWWDIRTCLAIIDILKIMFPDENYLYYHGYLAVTKRQLARLYAKNGDYDLALQMLTESKNHAEQDDEIEHTYQTYRFTSPFFDKTEFNPENFCHSGDDSSLTALYEVLEKKEFDPIRDREDFRALLPAKN